VTAAFDRADLTEVEEVVFCGYGEPTERLDILVKSAEYIKKEGNLPIRLNTNGLGDLINNTKAAKQLAPNIDTVSISLNAPTREEYFKLCRPAFGPNSFDSILSFAKDCKASGMNVIFTVMDSLGERKIYQCRRLCDAMGIRLRVRKTG
jgi:TatD family-associated radical SAM protein